MQDFCWDFFKERYEKKEPGRRITASSSSFRLRDAPILRVSDIEFRTKCV